MIDLNSRRSLPRVSAGLIPAIAKHFARVTFLSDNRADLAAVRVPSLIGYGAGRQHDSE